MSQKATWPAHLIPGLCIAAAPRWPVGACRAAHLVSVSQAHLHRPARMLDGGHRAGARATIVSRDLDDISVGLGDPACHSTYASLSDQLDRHLGLGVDLQGPTEKPVSTAVGSGSLQLQEADLLFAQAAVQHGK